MSYIVPRDIPKGCEYCPFNGHTKCRMMPIGFDEYPLVSRRPDWCPLIECRESLFSAENARKFLKENHQRKEKHDEQRKVFKKTDGNDE